MQFFSPSWDLHRWHDGRYDALLPVGVWGVHVSLELSRPDVVVTRGTEVVYMVLHIQFEIREVVWVWASVDSKRLRFLVLERCPHAEFEEEAPDSHISWFA